MKIYSYPTLSDIDSCPYIEGNEARYRYFFAEDLSEEEWEYFVSLGFRKFGNYIFKPECPNCQKCQPLRVIVNDFKASKSQRRVINKNQETILTVKNLSYQKEVYDLYRIHSEAKFDTLKHPIASKEEFIRSHFTKTSPGLLTKYTIEGKLVAAGFLDITQHGLSSVYFIYHPEFSDLSLGTYGAIKEIEMAKEMGKSFYYLGYFIEENQSMKYKSSFRPFQILKGENWT